MMFKVNRYTLLVELRNSFIVAACFSSIQNFDHAINIKCCCVWVGTYNGGDIPGSYEEIRLALWTFHITSGRPGL